MLRLSPSILVAALACRGLLASRVTEVEFEGTLLAAREPPKLGGSAADVGMICGGPQMWNLLTASSSVQGVQNIKWSKMEALRDDHIQHQEISVKELELEIESLTGLIAKKEGEKSVKYTSAEQHRKLVEAALGPDSFGSLTVAKDSGCGRVGGGPVRAPRKAYRKSLPLFEAAAADFFAGKQFRLDGDGFVKSCGELLPAVSERSACIQLCQQYKDMAQKASNEAVGETAGDVDALIKKRDQKAKELADSRTSIVGCDKAWEGISTLRTHVMGLKEDMQERFDLLRKAEEDLDDARWELTDLEDQLKEEESALKLAVGALEEAGQATAKADANLQDLTNKEKAMRARLEGLQGPMQQSRQQLSAAKRADKTVVDLKSAVSATMVKMELFSQASVVEPLKNIGFEPELDLASPDFMPEPMSTKSGRLLESSVDGLHEFCTATALPAFVAAKGTVDLDPLCKLDRTDKLMQGVNEAVLTRGKAIKKDLLWLKSWLNPYRTNKKMTKERAEELVALGEPKGFQEIVSFYHRTNFFKYLKDWRYDGPFLKLLAQLRTLKETLNQAVIELEAEVKQLKAELVELNAAREKAAAALQQMADKLDMAKEKKAAVEASVISLRESAAKMSNDIAELEEAVRKAKEAYDAAAAMLVAAHAEGTSALPEGKSSLSELAAQSREVDLLVSLIQQSLDRTEQSYQSVQSQIERLKQQ